MQRLLIKPRIMFDEARYFNRGNNYLSGNFETIHKSSSST